MGQEVAARANAGHSSTGLLLHVTLDRKDRRLHVTIRLEGPQFRVTHAVLLRPLKSKSQSSPRSEELVPVGNRQLVCDAPYCG